MKPIHSLLFYVLIIAILVLHFSCQSEIKTPTSEVPSANSNFGLSPYLLEAATLNLEYRSHSKLLDVRKKEAYEEGHLAGAIQVWRSDICRQGFKYSGLRSSKDSLALFLKKIGVQMQDSIILYDAKGNPDAARLWWLLHYYGYKNAYLLNKGLQAYEQKYWKKGPSQHLQEGDFEFENNNNKTLLATKEDVIHALTDSNYFLLDCRSQAEYDGIMLKKGAFRAGHIPESVHINYSEAIAYENKQAFRGLQDLKRRFAKVPENRKIIVYCQSGVRSALVTFVLRELMGYPFVANYDGSWIEWSFDKDLPIMTSPPN